MPSATIAHITHLMTVGLIRKKGTQDDGEANAKNDNDLLHNHKAQSKAFLVSPRSAIDESCCHMKEGHEGRSHVMMSKDLGPERKSQSGEPPSQSGEILSSKRF